ncbi:hypothetical protein PRIPAC_82866 [Pristionchus pacificus]|uniref:Large ribosomal subunit protein uL15 n=1 Tax=Pristionchus pacificus TaxID=54126 RepID=A0A2A6CJB7_PRIPA|nr:hypothetical protein PRIPAC_82866 [Pristionchus pacificus]|eukprot:PDM78314.1 ribosomal protein [Pristionchus pacificus]
MEGLFRKEGNAARMKNSQDCANRSDAERFRREIAKTRRRPSRSRLASTPHSSFRTTIKNKAHRWLQKFERSFFAHSIQTSASLMLKDGYYLTLRQLLVIVKAKFFSHSAEQKIKAAGGTCVLVAKGTIDSARKLSFEKCRDQHVYKIISTITGVDAFRIAAFLEVGSP